MKKILAVLLALILVLGVTSAFADEMKKPIKVGVTIYQFNDNFMTLYRTELQKYLEETYGAQVTVVDGKNDQTEQTNQINSFIAEGVDENALLVPQRALRRDPKGQASVLLVDGGGKVDVRLVDVGRTVGDSWQVLSGLKPGDRVIVEGGQNVRPGMSVKIRGEG